MEPFKITIEVNLGQETLAALRQIFSAKAYVTASQVEAPAADPAPKTQPAPAPAPTPEPAPAQPEAPIDDIGDLPPGNEPEPAPAPAPVPTESDARNAVQAARKRGVSAATIKAYMKDSFGIAASVDCPAERRQELIDGLAKLAA